MERPPRYLTRLIKLRHDFPSSSILVVNPDAELDLFVHSASWTYSFLIPSALALPHGLVNGL